MKRVLTAEQMKKVDEYTIKNIGIESIVLMERAAFGVYEIIKEKYDKRVNILIVCGSGNNGADGVALARMLKQDKYRTTIYCAGDESHFTNEMLYQTKIARKINIKFVNEPCYSEYDLIVDALFGIGLSRAVEGKYREIIEAINNSRKNVVAVDIPSGINGDDGNIMGICVRADITVTFGALKFGHIINSGREYCGEIFLKDAGFVDESFDETFQIAKVYEKDDIKQYFPKRKMDSNKGTYGKLLIIAGSKNMCGAACLCARAAYKTGVGLVTIFTPEENRTIIQTALPEAIVKTYLSDEFDLSTLVKEIEKADYIVCGPGIGISATTKKIVENVIASGKRCLLDADALNIISGDKESLKKLNENIIITPHVGEFSRLSGKDISDIKKNIYENCKCFAKENKTICVLKDFRTVIVSPEGESSINVFGNSGMSTAGSGDVLAGIIGGIACQTEDDYRAAATGVAIHALSGDEAAGLLGQHSLMASDIIDNISNSIRNL